MAKKQRAVRWEPWIERAINELAKEKKKTFSWMANYLIGSKIHDFGFTQLDFEPDMKDLEEKAKKKKTTKT